MVFDISETNSEHKDGSAVGRASEMKKPKREHLETHGENRWALIGPLCGAGEHNKAKNEEISAVLTTMTMEVGIFHALPFHYIPG